MKNSHEVVTFFVWGFPRIPYDVIEMLIADWLAKSQVEGWTVMAFNRIHFVDLQQKHLFTTILREKRLTDFCRSFARARAPAEVVVYFIIVKALKKRGFSLFR